MYSIVEGRARRSWSRRLVENHLTAVVVAAGPVGGAGGAGGSGGAAAAADVPVGAAEGPVDVAGASGAGSSCIGRDSRFQYRPPCFNQSKKFNVEC